MTLKELREEAKAKKIPNWWNKNTQQLQDELAALKSEAKETAEIVSEPVVEIKDEKIEPVQAEQEPAKTEEVKTEEKKDVPAPEGKKRNKCTVNGISLVQACKDRNLPYFTIYDRINRLGWDVDKALNTPVRAKKG